MNFCRSFIRDIVVDICYKAGISARKEAPIEFSSEAGKDLRLVDLLL